MYRFHPCFHSRCQFGTKHERPWNWARNLPALAVVRSFPNPLLLGVSENCSKEFGKLLPKWKKRGDLDQADILSAQSISLGLVESFTEKFVGAGDVLEAELQKHRRERSKEAH